VWFGLVFANASEALEWGAVGGQCVYAMGKLAFTQSILFLPPGSHTPHNSQGAISQLGYSSGEQKTLTAPQISLISPPPALTHTHTHPILSLVEQYHHVIWSHGTRAPQCPERTQKPLFLVAAEVSIESPSWAGIGDSCATFLTKADLFFGGGRG
jgi:hypothetical protein